MKDETLTQSRDMKEIEEADASDALAVAITHAMRGAVAARIAR